MDVYNIIWLSILRYLAKSYDVLARLAWNFETATRFHSRFVYALDSSTVSPVRFLDLTFFILRTAFENIFSERIARASNEWETTKEHWTMIEWTAMLDASRVKLERSSAHKRWHARADHRFDTVMKDFGGFSGTKMRSIRQASSE